MIDDPWAGLLDADETVVWQGQPDARIDWRALKPFPAAMGAVFTLVGLGVAGATLAGRTAPFPEALVPLVMGLLFAAAGLRASIGDVVLDGYARSRTWYTLTSRRLLIATDTFGRRRLRDVPLTPDTRLVFEDGTPGSILVGGREKDGLRRIPDARHVYRLMRDVQQGHA